jgi:hypothetical protein
MSGAPITEAFPDFVDTLPPTKAEPLHCIIHCFDDICKRMTPSGINIPPCHCSDDMAQEELPVSPPKFTGPGISLTDTIFDTILDIVPAHEAVTINRKDEQDLVARLEPLVVLRTFDDMQFMNEIRALQPTDPVRVATEVIMAAFDLISLYFCRTMKVNKTRTVQVVDPRAELKVYLSTGLVEWIQAHCAEREQDEIFGEMEDARYV